VASQLVTELPVERHHADVRVRAVALRIRAVALLGPVTVVAGIVWAIAQPYRLTFLHPRGEGFWWLAIEPPLLVMFAGIVFGWFVARPLIADMEAEDDGTA
jgi:hypothetical protein